MQYEIRVNGHLGARWAAWFDGLAITSEGDGTTVLRGSVFDQARCTASCRSCATSASR